MNELITAISALLGSYGLEGTVIISLTAALVWMFRAYSRVLVEKEKLLVEKHVEIMELITEHQRSYAELSGKLDQALSVLINFIKANGN